MLQGETRVCAKKGHKYWSDRWIALKFLLEFLNVVFFKRSMESLFSEEEVSLGHIRVTIQKNHNF